MTDGPRLCMNGCLNYGIVVPDAADRNRLIREAGWDESGL